MKGVYKIRRDTVHCFPAGGASIKLLLDGSGVIAERRDMERVYVGEWGVKDEGGEGGGTR